MTTENELLPTSENLNDPYVLQLIEALSGQQDEIEDLNKELQSCNAEGVADLEMRFEHQKAEAARLQLVAGRYQFMWEAAQLCINKIDDWFEYANNTCDPDTSQNEVRKHLVIYTEAVSKSKAQIGK